jgi:hypothetical protein
MIALGDCAAVGYAAVADIRRALYWDAASVLTATVTF